MDSIPGLRSSPPTPPPGPVTVRSTLSKTDGSIDEPEALRAIVRVRPFLPSELYNAMEAGKSLLPCVFPDEGNRLVVDVGKKHAGKRNELNNAKPSKATTEKTSDSTFVFDQVLWSVKSTPEEARFAENIGCIAPLPTTSCSQFDVFQAVGGRNVEQAFEGYNSCIFAYGQTGSGKSHTVIGPENDPGLAPRIIASMFHRIDALRAKDPYVQCSLDIAVIEIYNERPTDLLAMSQRAVHTRTHSGGSGSDGLSSTHSGFVHARSVSELSSDGNPLNYAAASPTFPPPNEQQLQNMARRRDKEHRSLSMLGLPETDTELRVRQHPDYGTYLAGLRHEVIDNEHSARICLQRALAHRTTATTKMNDSSSRSHAMIQLTLQQESKLRGTKKIALLNLIDLAGSERIKQSGVQGQNLTEAKNINLSLTTLRRVIDTMLENQSRLEKNLPLLRPPYREALLTYLLSDSLGGNSKTTMLATVSPHPDYIEDTLNTLRYASRAMAIVCHVRVNKQSVATTVAEVQNEVDTLRSQLQEAKSDAEEKPIPRMRRNLHKKAAVINVISKLSEKKRQKLEAGQAKEVADISAVLETALTDLHQKQEVDREAREAEQNTVAAKQATEADQRSIAENQKAIESIDKELLDHQREIELLMAPNEEGTFEERMEKRRALQKALWRSIFINAANEVISQRREAQLRQHQDDLQSNRERLEGACAKLDEDVDKSSTERQRVMKAQQQVDDIALRQIQAYDKEKDVRRLRREVAELRKQTARIRDQTDAIEAAMEESIRVRNEGMALADEVFKQHAVMMQSLEKQRADLEEEERRFVATIARAQEALDKQNHAGVQEGYFSMIKRKVTLEEQLQREASIIESVITQTALAVQEAAECEAEISLLESQIAAAEKQIEMSRRGIANIAKDTAILVEMGKQPSPLR